ncbi:replication initiator protein A [Gottfriedia acidiceleris]|uniref:replication initiator protein A n=1 Tax=Gottfriedia acidiceleris TaxID=371036 RepID=UPI0033991877
MSNERINIKDVISEEFYQLPKVFFWKKQYREELSPGAKLLYMLVRDRFTLSMYTTAREIEKGSESPAFVDDKGDIYCILDNQEIEFTLNTSTKTVIKFMDELIAVDLIAKEPEDGGANRIYLKKPDSSGASLGHFKGELEFYKHVKARKKKGKEPVKTLEECVAAQVSKFDLKKPKQEGGKNSTTGEDSNNSTTSAGENTPPGDVDIPPLGDEQTPPPGMENLHPNNNYSSDLDSSDLDSSNLYPNLNQSSSNEDSNNNLDNGANFKGEKPSEEELINNVITVTDNYSLLNSTLLDFQICTDLKGINVVKKTLHEAKIELFYKSDLANALGSHAMNKEKMRINGEVMQYEPIYFANNLVDRIRENEEKRQLEAERKREEASKQQQVYQSSGIPFYNWLEK